MGKKDVYEINRINPRGEGYCTFIGLVLKCLGFLLFICIVMLVINHFIREQNKSTVKNTGRKEDDSFNAAKVKMGENMNSTTTESVTGTTTVASTETTSVKPGFTVISTESTGTAVTVTPRGSTDLTDTVTPVEPTTITSHMDKSTKDPTNTCVTKECKQIASELLYVKSHNAESCDNFFNYTCEGRELEDSDYFKYDYDKILNMMKSSSERYLRHFKTFHDSCVEFNNDTSLKRRLENVFSVIQPVLADNDINRIIIESILTQSNPFFDIGIKIGESQNFEYEIFPSDAQRRMFKADQNLFQRIQEQCISENEEQNIKSNIKTTVKECTVRKLTDYFGKFTNELKKLNKELSITLNQTHIDILKKHSHASVTADKPTLIKEFNMSSSYQFGVDWIQIFNGISKNNVTEDSVVTVHNSEHLKEVFKKLQNIENRDLIQMLALFLGLELYEDVIMYLPPKNIHSYCLKLCSSLMPDVATIAVYNSTDVIDSSPIQTIFNEVKKQLENSLNKSQLPKEYISSAEEKIRNATLFTMNFSSKNYREANYDVILNELGNFSKSYLLLLKNYKKLIYSNAGLEVSPQKLLQYFLSPFSNRPKAFVPSNYVVFHKGFLQKISEGLPAYVRLAQIGFQLGKELLKYMDFKGLEKYPSVWNNISTNSLPRPSNRDVNTVSIAGVEFKSTYSFAPAEAIIDNGAFRLLTDLYNTSSDKPDLVWINQSYTKEQVFALTAMQDQCEEDSYTSFVESIMEDKLPSFIKVESILKNSEFLSDQFACTFDANYTSQFPYIGLSQNTGVPHN